MIEFPVYRKYTNSKTYFKVINEKCFEEFHFIGDRIFNHTINAIQYPEQLRILDMIECKDGIWIEIDEQEYEAKKSSP
ncbi:MAG: hypothetical protein H6600_01075 [Flavobacteriales bacterium]|nr:hypothetical protein [Flavobacteriales bacterium]MCB9197029.1 hypothetical protein [Flavobacteriales bacterium]